MRSLKKREITSDHSNYRCKAVVDGVLTQWSVSDHENFLQIILQLN